MGAWYSTVHTCNYYGGCVCPPPNVDPLDYPSNHVITTECSF